MERPRYVIYDPIKTGYFQALDHPFQDWMEKRNLLSRNQDEIDEGLEHLQHHDLSPHTELMTKLLLSEENRGFVVPATWVIQAVYGETFDFATVRPNGSWRTDFENNLQFQVRMSRLRSTAGNARRTAGHINLRFYNHAVSVGVSKFLLGPKETYILFRLYSQLNEGKAIRGEQILDPLYQDPTEKDRDLSLEANLNIHYLRRDLTRSNSDIRILTEPVGYRLAVL